MSTVTRHKISVSLISNHILVLCHHYNENINKKGFKNYAVLFYTLLRTGILKNSWFNNGTTFLWGWLPHPRAG